MTPETGHPGGGGAKPQAGVVDGVSTGVVNCREPYGGRRGSRCESDAVPPLSPGSALPTLLVTAGPAGWKARECVDPGARRLSPPVTSSQGADPE